MPIPRILTYYGDDLLRIDKDGKITICSGVTPETLAEALLESTQQTEHWRQRAEQNLRIGTLFRRSE
jgi:hypothetical protein